MDYLRAVDTWEGNFRVCESLEWAYSQTCYNDDFYTFTYHYKTGRAENVLQARVVIFLFVPGDAMRIYVVIRKCVSYFNNVTTSLCHCVSCRVLLLYIHTTSVSWTLMHIMRCRQRLAFSVQPLTCIYSTRIHVLTLHAKKIFMNDLRIIKLAQY